MPPDTSPHASLAARPPGHPPVASGRIGVLLVNLGTPDATDYWAMRRYLKEFLSDRRVIETSRLLWWPLLNLVILSRRPQAKGRDYAAIWNQDRDESPLKTVTRSQAEKLAAFVAADGLAASPLAHDPDRLRVDWAMRYGNPSIRSRIEVLQQQGCERLLVVPLYPQYSAATTATVCDKVFEALATMRWQPTLRVAPPWHDEPIYIEALATSVRQHLAGLDFEPEMILASFHGVPRQYLDKGDPYHCHCAKTARLLGTALGLDASRFRHAFQSRFGPAEWLRPYTDETIKALARDGVKRLVVLTPGFVGDCLETIEEIGVENAGYFRDGGGTHFSRVPCLNDSPEGMQVIEAVVARELQGWL